MKVFDWTLRKKFKVTKKENDLCWNLICLEFQQNGGMYEGNKQAFSCSKRVAESK